MKVRSIRLIALVLLATLCASPVWAQSADTGILGTVTDSSGAIVPGSDVTITNASTGVAQSVVSGPNGTFEVRYLLPGDYTIQASLAGFRTERTTVTIRVGQTARLNFVLEVGNIGEVVDVEAQGLLLETQSGVTGNVVTSESLVNMPLSGRNFTQLGNLTAGVVASNTQFRTSGARGMYQQVSFDGVSALNNRGNNLFMYPSVDAVEEFKVQATNYTAEYGGHAGANVQLQLKSGSNSLHGSAFNYVRDDSLDARNYFAKAPTPKPQLDRQQFGGVVGGPVRRNQTFFMGSYEGVQETRETVAQANVLTPEMRRGDFSAVLPGTVVRDPMTGLAFPGNIIPSDRLDPLAVSMINAYQPLPNQTGANNFRGFTQNKDTQHQMITRVDHVISQKQKIFGHYLYQYRDNPTIPINPEFPAPRLFKNHSMAVQHVATWSSSLLNEIRFGYMRGDLNRLSPRRLTGFSVEDDLGIHGMLVGGPNGRPPNENEIGFPSLTIQGFNGFGDSTGGEGIDLSQTYQFVDNLTVIRGRHALKMGGDVRRMMGDATSTNAPFGALDFTRDISGHAAAAFMLGFPKVARTPEGIPIGGIRQWRTGFYFQDDWRVTPRMTVNLGLRFDKNLPPKDINGVSRTLRFDLPNGPVLWPGPGEVVDQLYFNEQRGWAPRLGLAYQMNDRLVLRGGYGIFNMALHLDNINTLGTNPPTASVQVTNPNTSPVATLAFPFPSSLVPANTIFNVTSAEVDRNHQDGYYQNWNVAVGYEVSRSAAVEVRYVGAKGSNLDTSLTNFNSPDPDPNAGSIPLQSRRPYPAYGRIRMWVTDGESDYHSLQSEFKQRGPWGLHLNVAYTLSKLNDNQQGGLNASRSRRQNPRSLEGEYAPSADDQRQRLVIGYVWDIPFGSDKTGFVGVLVKGWQLSGLGIFNSGSPVYINQDGDTLNVDSEEIRPNLVAGQNPELPSDERTIARWFNTAAFARATTTYGNSQRNPVVGPGRKVFDISLAKFFPMTHGQQLQFRIEAFNAFNWVNWGNPNGSLGNSNFGIISSAQAAREMQLSLKYLF